MKALKILKWPTACYIYTQFMKTINNRGCCTVMFKIQLYDISAFMFCKLLAKGIKLKCDEESVRFQLHISSPKYSMDFNGIWC
jgi:hypothetical protein